MLFNDEDDDDVDDDDDDDDDDDEDDDDVDDDDEDEDGGSVIATTCAPFCAATNFISSRNTGDLVALVMLHWTRNLDPPSVMVDAIFSGCNTLKR